MGYTTREGLDVLAFGPSAISEFANVFAQVEKALPDWFEAVEAGRLATSKGHRLTADDSARRWIIGRIMCEAVVSSKEVESRFGTQAQKDYISTLDQMQSLEEDGLIEVSANRDLRVLPLGRLLLRHVAMAFDAYLGPQSEMAAKTFSQTV